MKVNKKAKHAGQVARKSKGTKSATKHTSRSVEQVCAEANGRGLASWPIVCLFPGKNRAEAVALIDRTKQAPKATGKPLAEVSLRFTPFAIHPGNVIRNTVNGNTFPLSALPADIREKLLRKAGLGKAKSKTSGTAKPKSKAKRKAKA